MAKATSPLRLQEELMQSAEQTAKRFHRSTAGQIEYWANLGRSVSTTLDPDVLLSIISGLATIKVEPVYSTPVDPADVFQSLEDDRQKGLLAESIGISEIRYQASHTNPGYLEQIDKHGEITIGQFENGEFKALIETDS